MKAKDGKCKHYYHKQCRINNLVCAHFKWEEQEDVYRDGSDKSHTAYQGPRNALMTPSVSC